MNLDLPYNVSDAIEPECQSVDKWASSDITSFVYRIPGFNSQSTDDDILTSSHSLHWITDTYILMPREDEALRVLVPKPPVVSIHILGIPGQSSGTSLRHAQPAQDLDSHHRNTAIADTSSIYKSRYFLVMHRICYSKSPVLALQAERK